MDNEICKITNQRWFKRIYEALRVLYNETKDSRDGFSLNLVYEENIFPYQSSEGQRTKLTELDRTVMILFYKRLGEIINKDSIRLKMIEWDRDLYEETIYMLKLKTFKRSEYLQWARDVVLILKKMTMENYSLYVDTYIFCQLCV